MGAGLLFVSFQANVPGAGQWLFLAGDASCWASA